MFPKISIIIPVYNVEPYLRNCLDSVVNQTMREIQIICINDGSTDNSSVILGECAGCDSRFLIINKTNGGVASARNAGLALAIGKYVIFVDSDDTVDIKLCEKVYEKAEQSNADFVLFFHDTSDNQRRICDITINTDDKVSWEEKKCLLKFGLVCGKLWRKDFLQKNNLKFYEKLYWLEDTMFYWHGLQLATKVSIFPEKLYHYNIHETSLSSSLYGNNSLGIFGIFTKCKLYLMEHELYQYYKSLFLRIEVDSLFGIYRGVQNEYKAEFLERLNNWIGIEEIDYMRHERHIDYSVTYFFYQITGDWRIFLMFVRRRVRAFLGENKRCVIRAIVNFIKKFQTKCKTSKPTNGNNNI
jgi:glycosyltransferase involved in cell wall biosynthesis